MKKVIAYAISILLLGLFFSGCVKLEANDLPLTTYVNKQSENNIKPSVTLQDKNRFEFFYSVESSYKAVGNYEINNEKLYLKTDDGKYQFVFAINDKSLIFIIKDSQLPPDLINICDQTVFDPIS